MENATRSFWKQHSAGQFSTTNYLGNATVLGGEEPVFLRAFAAWLRDWQQERISNCERFTLTSQMASSFTRTLLCHSSLIEDLLEEGYEFVLTSRFQSDSIERRFAQYRQMGGGRFLVGLKDVTSSEKVTKIREFIERSILTTASRTLLITTKILNICCKILILWTAQQRT